MRVEPVVARARAIRWAISSESVDVRGRDAEALDFVADLVDVDQVAVVGQRQAARGPESTTSGWAFSARLRAGGRVARVADGQVAAEFGQVALVEDLADQAHARSGC